MIQMDYPTMGIVITAIIAVMTLLIKYFPGRSMDGRTTALFEAIKDLMASQQDLLQKQQTELSMMRDTIDRSHKKLDDVRMDVGVIKDRVHG